MTNYIIAIYEQKNGVPRVVQGTQKSTDIFDLVERFIHELDRKKQDGQFIGTGNREIAEQYKVPYIGQIKHHSRTGWGF